MSTSEVLPDPHEDEPELEGDEPEPEDEPAPEDEPEPKEASRTTIIP